MASVLAVAAGAACSTTSDSAREVTMLWVGTDADGTLASGTLRADVNLIRGGSTVEIDVGGDVVESGPVWNAAARNALATALLLGGVPPEGLRFSVAASDTIDGPSAGGLVAVAALADLLGLALRDDVSMTGTLQPNGSLGPVAGIPEKLRAARAAGITTVVIPAAVSTAFDPRTGVAVDVAEFARELGIDVVFASSILEAADVLIDDPVPGLEPDGDVGSDTSAIDVEASFASVVDALATRLGVLEVAEAVYPGHLVRVESLRGRLADGIESITSSSVPGSSRPDPVSLLALEREILAWNAGIEALDAAADSIASGAAHVRREADAVLAVAADALLAVATTPFDHVETFMALVDVAEWAADAVETAHAIADIVDRVPVTSQYLFDAAVDLAEAAHDLDNIMPVALEIARGTGRRAMSNEMLAIAEDLVALLDVAIAANAEVIDVTRRTDSFSIDATNAIAMITSWGVVDSVLGQIENPRARLIASLADSVSRYVESSRIVNLNHLVSFQDSVLTDLVLDDLDAISEQLDVAHELSSVTLDELDRRGLDTRYFVWEREWANAFSGAEAPTTTFEPLMDGLTRLWFDNVNQQLLVSLTSARP